MATLPYPPGVRQCRKAAEAAERLAPLGCVNARRPNFMLIAVPIQNFNRIAVSNAHNDTSYVGLSYRDEEQYQTKGRGYCIEY